MPLQLQSYRCVSLPSPMPNYVSLTYLPTESVDMIMYVSNSIYSNLVVGTYKYVMVWEGNDDKKIL